MFLSKYFDPARIDIEKSRISQIRKVNKQKRRLIYGNFIFGHLNKKS